MSFDQRGFYNITGKLLKKYRKRANMTQKDIAGVLDMPRATYANIESGRQRAMADVIWRLAIEYGVTTTKLLPKPIRGEADDTTNQASSNLSLKVNLSDTADNNHFNREPGKGYTF